MEYRLVKFNDYKGLASYFARNEPHFRPWQPKGEHDADSLENWKIRVTSLLERSEKGLSAYFVAADTSDGICGHCSLSQIVYGPFRACYMGFSVCKSKEGQSIAYQLASTALQYALPLAS